MDEPQPQSQPVYAPPEPGDVVVEDDDSFHVHYLPEKSWGSWDSPAYHGSSYHRTLGDDVYGAFATFSFNGSYVAYYSDRNKDHGSFNVSIDGGAPVELSSYSANFVQNRMLYSTTLPAGPHMLAVTNTQEHTVVGVDYFVYRPQKLPVAASTTTTDTSSRSAESGSATSTTTAVTSATASPSPTASHSQGVALDPPAVVGIAFGAVASALLLVLCVVAIRRRREKRRRKWEGEGKWDSQSEGHWKGGYIRAWRKACM